MAAMPLLVALPPAPLPSSAPVAIHRLATAPADAAVGKVAAPPAPPPRPVAPPPVPRVREALQSPDAASAGPPELVEWIAGPVTCGGKPVATRWIEPPLPTLAAPQAARAPRPVSFSFRLNAEGRPLSIAYDTAVRGGVADMASLMAAFGVDDNVDLEPALASSRFAPGAERANCRITYSRHQRPLFGQPDAARLRMAALMFEKMHGGQQMLSELFARPDGDCLGKITPRTLNFPPFDELPTPEGRLSLTLHRFDIDAAGKVTGYAEVYSDQSAPVRQAAREAIVANRFKSGDPHKGCLAVDVKQPESSMIPPVRPPLAGFAPKDATCPLDSSKLYRVNEVPFPERFNRRSIEGWAVVRFDMSSDGSIGAVKALAAEPASGFGAAAEAVVRAAEGTASARGYRGCVVSVRFTLDDSRDAGVYGGIGWPAKSLLD